VNFGRGRGSEQEGLRPALVIQNDQGNEYSPTTIVASMTSRRTDYDFHVPIRARDSGLSADSTVMLEQIQTVAMGRLSRRIGALGPDKMEEVDRALHHSLGLVD
jgi:mRNA interferase MazF